MALGADRYASRADTLVFIGCVLLSIAAMGLPDRMRDPFARALRQTVLAPLLALQQQTERLSASLERYDAVVAERDSAALAATFLAELRSENQRLRGLLGLVPERTLTRTSGRGGGLRRGIPSGTVVGVAGEAAGWERTYLVRPAVHPAAVTHVMILTGPPLRSDLRSLFESGSPAP